MRLLHTSDWHLGRSLHRCDLRDAQAAHLDHLVEVVRSERVDAVLVAGDVFDRAVPPVDAVALYDEALFRLRDAGARVVVTSGNHDSASRLGVGARLVDAAGVHVRTRPQDCGAPVLLADEHGEVAVYGLPYLEPEAVRTLLPPDPGGSARGRRAGTPACSAGRWRACAPTCRARPARSVVLAHAWVTGGELSDSERDIRVGGVGDVSAALFDGIDYTALGHLHGAQVLRPGLRYSGSPLAFSFSEAASRQGLVARRARRRAGSAGVERVPAPVPRRLSSLTGDAGRPARRPALAAQEDDWLSVVLTDPVRPDDPMARLRTRFPHVLVLDWQPAGAVADERTYGARVAGRDDLEVVAEFVRHVRCGGSTSEAGAADDDERALLAAGARGRPARGGVGMRPHRIRLRAFGPFAGEVEVDLDALGRRRAVPAARRDRLGQDDAARRHRLRAVRPGARRPGQDRAAAVRPRRPGRPHRGRARGHARRPALADHPQPGAGAPQGPRHGHDHRAGRASTWRSCATGRGRRSRPASTRPPPSSTRCSA